MTELVTPRLILRRWQEPDLDAYARLVANADVMRYFTGGPLNRAGAWRQIALFIGHQELRGFSQAAVIDRASGQFIGRGGLWQPEGWPGLEVGWMLDPAVWGQGFASELGRAARDLAFGSLKAEHLISLIHPDNRRSARVAQAIGAHFEEATTVAGLPCLIYGQRRP